MNERLAKHFLRRLRREAEALALESAVEAGILVQESVESHGRVLNVFRRGPAAPDTLSARRVASILSRRRRRLPGESVHSILRQFGSSCRGGGTAGGRRFRCIVRRDGMPGACFGPDH